MLMKSYETRLKNLQEEIQALLRREDAIGDGDRGSEPRQVSSSQELDQERHEEAEKVRQEGRDFCLEIGRDGGHFHRSRRDSS